MVRIFTVFLCLIFITCGQNQQLNAASKQTKPDWKILNESNYSIQYPAEWELNKSGQMGASFFLFSPIKSSQDKFRENVNLIIQDLTGYNVDLDKYVEISEGQIKTMVTNSILIESKRNVTGSTESHRMVYTGDQGMFHLKFEQYFWVKNDKAFVLTLTCEKDSFENYKEIGETILKSFNLK